MERMLTIGLPEKQRIVFRCFFEAKNVVTLDFADNKDAESILCTMPLIFVLLNASNYMRSDVQSVVDAARKKSDVPILAVSKEEHLLSIMRQGVDICLPNHYSDELIMEHVAKAIKRYTSCNNYHTDYPDTRVQYAHDLIVDKVLRYATVSGKELHLTRKEYQLLDHFYSNRGRVLTQEEISKALWPGEASYKRDVAKVVSELRVKLGDKSDCPKYIRTIRGKGYIFLP